LELVVSNQIADENERKREQRVFNLYETRNLLEVHPLT
jgi:hypothetical protein